jgi:hypothetical protein
MANMSYCRFHNTLSDLNDCESALNAFINDDENTIESREERHKAKKLIELCQYIAENYSPEDIDEYGKHYDEEDQEEEDD